MRHRHHKGPEMAERADVLSGPGRESIFPDISQDNQQPAIRHHELCHGPLSAPSKSMPGRWEHGEEQGRRDEHLDTGPV